MAIKFDKILGTIRESDSTSLQNVITLKGIISQKDVAEKYHINNNYRKKVYMCIFILIFINFKIIITIFFYN